VEGGYASGCYLSSKVNVNLKASFILETVLYIVAYAINKYYCLISFRLLWVLDHPPSLSPPLSIERDFRTLISLIDHDRFSLEDEIDFVLLQTTKSEIYKVYSLKL
jgi:hypothetical protein